jgi:hypothetical protein
MKGIVLKIYVEIFENKLYYMLLSIIISIVTILNWNANLMEGILKYYLTFSNYFKNGLNYNQIVDHNFYTWPMWGYGLVLLLKFKILIILLQQLLTILVIIIVRLYLKNRIDKKSYRIVAILILCAMPWYIFQVSLWPYGISANLLTISLLLLSNGLEKSKLNYVILSAIIFGIMLNLRSDYFYFVFILGITIVLINYFLKYSKKISLYIFYWVSIILITLTPWGIHSYKYSNKFSFVSSNSGHVFYISLGQLPGNKWNITPSDGDLTMRKYIDSSLSVKESTLTSRSNKLLMSRFFELIKKDPKEYFKKCIFNLKSFIKQPFYFGLVQSNNYSYDKIKLEFKKQIRENNYNSAVKLLYHEFGLYIIFLIFAYLISQVILILVIFSTYKYFKKINRNKNINININILNYFIILVFFYQIALSVFAYYLPVYSTNIFLLLIILIGNNFNNKTVLN